MDEKMAISRKGLILMLAGLVVMLLGYALMTGGGVTDPAVFNEAMFSWRRIVLAPVVILAGIALIIVAILKDFGGGKKKK